MVTYPGDMAYIRVQYYVHHLCMYVYVCAYVYVCIKSKISLRISQGNTNARQLYESEKAARLFFTDCKANAYKKITEQTIFHNRHQIFPTTVCTNTTTQQVNQSTMMSNKTLQT